MTNLTPETQAELRRLAEACPMPDNDPNILSEWYELGDLTERNHPLPPIDAAFIAAASPAVVLGLLDRMTDLQNRLRRAESAIGGLAEVAEGSEQVRLRGKLEGVRLALDYLREMT